MADTESLMLAKIAAEAIKAGHPISRHKITERRYNGCFCRSKIARDAAPNIARRVEIANREKQRKAA